MTDRRSDTILRQPDVLARTGLRRSTLYRKITKGAFPAQIRLGENCVGWHESDVSDWVANPR